MPQITTSFQTLPMLDILPTRLCNEKYDEIVGITS